MYVDEAGRFAKKIPENLLTAALTVAAGRKP